MIRYTLVCENDHEFDGWFASGKAYDAQAKQGQVHCPVCGSANVSKGVMAPNLAKGSERVRDAEPAAQSRDEAVAAVRKFREHVVKHSEDVGDRFAEEARKIHYKETEPRPIIGSASDSEAKELREEGVDFHPLPPLPEERN